MIIPESLQSMPKMPEGEKKEESAESLAEKKEQVSHSVLRDDSNLSEIFHQFK